VQGAKPSRHRIGVKPHGAKSGSCAIDSSPLGTSYPETHRANTEPGESFQSFHACLAACRKRRLRPLCTKHMRRNTQGSCCNLLSRALRQQKAQRGITYEEQIVVPTSNSQLYSKVFSLLSSSIRVAGCPTVESEVGRSRIAGREPYASHPWHLTRASCNRVPAIRLFPFDCPASWSSFSVTSLSCSIFRSIFKQENSVGAWNPFMMSVLGVPATSLNSRG
jgi:hypothetical protein